MSFTIEQLQQVRPFLFHFAPESNRTSLSCDRTMYSTQNTVQKLWEYNKEQIASVKDFLSTPRIQSIQLRLDNSTSRFVTLNDQQPLRESQFLGLSCTFGEYVALLNSFVFFWPGDGDGPMPGGRRAAGFAKKYKDYGCLRVPVRDAWNDKQSPLFCEYNSGAPRKCNGIERGSEIFQSADSGLLRAGQVVEVVFKGVFSIPDSAEWRSPGKAKWEPLRRVC